MLCLGNACPGTLREKRLLRLSIIIPTFNEARNITDCLDSVFYQEHPCQVIVADGGSSDGTLDLVRPPAQVVAADKGRAGQMNAGARLATGDVLLFLHADTRLPPGGLACLAKAMGQNTAPGGVFRLSFDPASPLLNFYAWCTRFSCRLFHYGDAGIFIRRDLFEEMGGYADLAIMEDLDLWLTLHRRGRPLILPRAVTTSSRRFLQHGAIRQQAVNAGLVALWLLGVNHRKLAAWYYGKNGR